MRRIELLSPAGNLDAGRAAIDCGADAVYIGGPAFGARSKAGNSFEDIARLVEYSRPYGVKVYGTLNTLIFENELSEAEQSAREMISAGTDALIIQDMAFLRMGLENVRFHASTQAANITTEHVKFLEHAGFSRAVLERGLTLEEIKNIRAASGIELECFIHGAICVSHSGRCYLSRATDGRSGNRGDCSQPCRLSYDLVDDNNLKLITGKHLISPRDLNLSDRIGDLMDAGVDSFKIEGRLKDIAYVKNITAWYRNIIDEQISKRPGLQRSSNGESLTGFTPDPQKTFSRPYTRWMIDGKKAGVSSFDTPKSTGAYIGRVQRIGKNEFVLENGRLLNPGDGVCYRNGNELEGTYINRVDEDTVYPEKIGKLQAGTEVYRNHDHVFESQVTKPTRRVITVDIMFSADVEYITLKATSDNITVAESLAGPYENASNPEKMIETFGTQLCKTGGTIFTVGRFRIENSTINIPFVPVSMLNQLRRKTLEKLYGALSEKNSVSVKSLNIEYSDYRYPESRIGAEMNVTNSLARKFYADHGAEEIVPGMDLADDFRGKRLMKTPYCILRETGRCNGKGAGAGNKLYLTRGKNTFSLEFDCTECMMNIISEN